MRKILSVALVGVMAMFTTSVANAVTLDFVAEASGNERGIADGTVIDFSGLDVTFSASVVGGGSAFAYFDDLSGGKPAGLGVCKVLTGSDQCNPGSDDNVTAGEAVTLGFDSVVTFSATSFWNADHVGVGLTNTLLIGLNGGGLISYTFAGVMAAIFEDVTSITFAYGGDVAEQFYVSGATAVSVVPLPAALPLYGAGVALLGFIGWRKRRIETSS